MRKEIKSMKKSHENWNDYHTASTDYPDALYKNTDRLEQRIRKESRKRKLLYTTIPTTAAALLFVILINTSIVFARTISEIPILSKISEMVMYNESLKSAVENKNIQYVNLKAVNGDIELRLPYVIADSRNLVLFLEMPENLEMKGNELYVVNIDHLKDLSNDNIISEGFFSYSGSYAEGQDPLLQVSIEFVDRDMPGFSIQEGLPQNFELSLSLQKYELGTRTPSNDLPLSEDSFKFELSLEPFKEPIIYPLDQEIILEGQKISFTEMISYPTRSTITYEFPTSNDSDMQLSLSIVEDGERYPLENYAGISESLSELTRDTLHIRSNYFSPPKTRFLSIDGYSKIRKDERLLQINVKEKTLKPSPEGINLIDIIKEDGQLHLTFSFSDAYTELPIESFLHEDDLIEITVHQQRTENGKSIFRYSIKDQDYETMEAFISGPETTLDNPILIPIPVNN